jgi:hypothetical protein
MAPINGSDMKFKSAAAGWFEVRGTHCASTASTGFLTKPLCPMNQLGSNKNSLEMLTSPLRDKLTSQLTCYHGCIIIH